MSNRIIRNLPDSKYKAVVGNTLAGGSNPFGTESEITDQVTESEIVNGLNVGIKNTNVDAAYIATDGIYRMPTKTECDELINNCTWTWSTQNGVNGYTVEGNGNSIFIPASGYRNGASLLNDGTEGYLWTDTFIDEWAFMVMFSSSQHNTNGSTSRYYGRTIRPVSSIEGVDLGLPSGLKWASVNIGATLPEDYGDYFAWAETETKESFTSENYICPSGSIGTELDPVTHVTKYSLVNILHKNNPNIHTSPEKEARWEGKQDALGFIPENSANKKTSLAENSDTYYPTQKAVKTALTSIENKLAIDTTTHILESDLSSEFAIIDSVVDGTITATLDGKMYPAIICPNNNRIEFVTQNKSIYLILSGGPSSYLSLTIDPTTNSGKIYRFTDYSSAVHVETISLVRVAYYSTIKVERVGKIYTIYVNGVSTWVIDFSNRTQPEWSTPVLGWFISSSGVLCTGATKTIKTIPESPIADIYESIDALYGNTTDTTELVGETMASLGDSIDAYNYVQPQLLSRFGMVSNQQLAVSGKKIISGATDSVVDQVSKITTTPKLITIGGGINDFGNNSPLGDLDSTDTTTFYGALKYIVSTLQNNHPNALLLFTTVPFSDWQTANDWAIGQVNDVGLTRADYAQAARNVFKLYGAVYADQFADLGWNLNNINDKTTDRLHPNSGAGTTDRVNLFSKVINNHFNG